MGKPNSISSSSSNLYFTRKEHIEVQDLIYKCDLAKMRQQYKFTDKGHNKITTNYITKHEITIKLIAYPITAMNRLRTRA